MTPSDIALNASDVARILRIGRNAVYALAKSGELKSYRMGRKLLFTLDDVTEYLARVRGESLADANANAGARSSTHDIADAIAPFKPDADPFVIAGEGSVCDEVTGLLRAHGLNVAHQAMCDYAALASLYAGDADAAVTCLHDRKTDSCTIPYVQRLIPGTSLVVMRIASYPVGLIVREGNPKGITSWSSLFRRGGTLANRPRGTAERVILDEKIAAFELVAQDVEGYENEAATAHDAAMLVAHGLVDVCIGSAQTASLVPGVRFVPLQAVTADLVIVKNGRTRAFLQDAKRIVASRTFRALFSKALPFDVSTMGAITYEL